MITLLRAVPRHSSLARTTLLPATASFRPLTWTPRSSPLSPRPYIPLAPYSTDSKNDIPPTQTPPTPSTQTPSTQTPRKKVMTKENMGKVRTFIRKYGPIGIITYFGMYGATLAGIYGLVSSGMLGANDAISLFQTLHLDKLIDLESLNPKAGNFAVAWILTKFTEPVRFGLTIMITPPLYRFITGRRAAREKEDEEDEAEEAEAAKKKAEEEEAEKSKKNV